MASYSSNKERINFFRLCRAIVDLCTDVLRDILSKHVSPPCLGNKVKKCAQYFKQAEIRNQDLKMITDATTTGSYKDLDLSLLYKILRLLCVQELRDILEREINPGRIRSAVDNCQATKRQLSIDELNDVQYSASVNSYDDCKGSLLNKIYMHLYFRYALQNRIHPSQIYQTVLKCPALKSEPKTKLNVAEVFLVRLAEKEKSYDNLENNLLHKLYQHLCSTINPNVIHPTKSWGQQPGPGEKNIGDDIERIHIMRNKLYGHINKAKVSDVDFYIYWNELDDIMTRMDQQMHGQYKRVLDEIKTERIDEATEKKYLDQVKYLSEKTEEIESRVTELESSKLQIDKKIEDGDAQLLYRINSAETEFEQTQSEHKETKTRINKLETAMQTHVKEIKEAASKRQKSIDERQTLAVIKEHRNSGVFVKTNASRRGKSLLEQNDILIYSGFSGDGKTSNAVNIMGEYLEEHPDWCFVIYDNIKQWANVDPDISSVILLEDCLGKTNTNVRLVDESKPYWRKIYSCVKSGKVKVILTIRQHVMLANKAQLENEVFKKEHIIDMTTNEYKLSPEEKLEIISNHCRKNNIDICTSWRGENYKISDKLDRDTRIRISEGIISEIVKTNPVIGFPFSCNMFVSQTKYTKQGIHFFKKPTEALKNTINKLMSHGSKGIEQLQYCLMSYMMLKGGDINLKNLDQEMLKQVSESLHISVPSNRDMKEAIENINHRYVLGENPLFSFIHQTILESVALCFYEDNAPLLLKLCSEHFISEFIRPETYETTLGEIIVKLNKTDYKNLIPNFIKTLIQGKNKGCRYKLWVKHPLIDDQNFVDALIDILKSDSISTQTIQDSVNDSLFGGLFKCACVHGKTHLIDGLCNELNIDITDVNFAECLNAASGLGHTTTVMWLLDHNLALEKIPDALTKARADTLTAMMQHKHITMNHLKQALRSDDICCQCGSETVNTVFTRWPYIEQTLVLKLLNGCCSHGNDKSIDVILTRSPSIITNPIMNKAFCKACFGGHFKVVELIMKRTPDALTKEKINEMFIETCLSGYTKVVEVFVNKEMQKFLEQQEIAEGLKRACLMGHSNIVDLFLKQFNTLTEQNMKDAFSAACVGGHSVILKHLLHRNVHYKELHLIGENNENITNLHIAAFFGRFDVLKELTDLGLVVDQTCRTGKSLLSCAMMGFKCLGMRCDYAYDVIKDESTLLSHFRDLIGSDIRLGNISDYRQILIYIIQQQNYDSADLDTLLDTNRCTLAHYCVVYNSPSIINILCKVYPSLVSVENSLNYKPIDLAVLMGRSDIFIKLYSITTHNEDKLNKLISWGRSHRRHKYESSKHKPDFIAFVPFQHSCITFGEDNDYDIITAALENAHLNM